MTKKRIIVIAAAAVVIAAGIYFVMPKSGSAADVNWITTTVEPQNITQGVTATGTIEPVTLVDVGTQVSGILTTLYVDYNSVVKQGQVIAELDKSTLQLDLDTNKSSVTAAKSKLDYQTSNYERVKQLFEKGLIADSEYEQALYDYETAQTSYDMAVTSLKRSEINLGYATIYSPIDGVVLSRSVEEGQTVASSFSTPTLFTVAADLKDMRVIVDVDEADIGNVSEGQRVEFTVDAFPLDKFEGVVTQVRQEATIESNVVTYEVVVSAANPDLKLKPGLTATVEIFVLDIDCEKTVSAAALEFSPSTSGAPAPAAMESPMGQRPEGAPMGQRPDGAPMGQRPDGAPMGGQGASANKSVAAASSSNEPTVVWVLNSDNMPEPRPVVVGVSNGILTQIEGSVSVGTEVIIGIETQATATSGSKIASSPFLQRRR
ncbi:MAG: efflux RND transporter periplasmic adaptor subunit [Rikenellaceae bacterium]